jgi:Ni/Fe-hydrogenase subunit HybB-like protein
MSDTDLCSIDQTVLDTLTRPGKSYWALVALLLPVSSWGGCWIYQIFVGIGVAGQNNPVAWGTYLINFVFWVGIAHSGTLISAILHLFRAGLAQSHRPCGRNHDRLRRLHRRLFPFIHLGRVWMVYYMLPFPNQRTLWPNFPVAADVRRGGHQHLSDGQQPVLVHGHAAGPGHHARPGPRVAKNFYGALLGWTGEFEQWRHYTRGYLFFAALATPLVISVHSVVSWDFALSVVPGWHTTIFAPYFVAGAIHSGLAMVLTLMIPLRRSSTTKQIITMHVLESVAKTIVFTGLIVGFAYATEFFIAWYSHNPVEVESFRWRAFGDYALEYWIMVVCNTIIPLLLLFKKIRTNIRFLFVISLIVNVGMWYERFVIIIGSVAHDFLPHAWGLYSPSWVEFGIMIGLSACSFSSSCSSSSTCPRSR